MHTEGLTFGADAVTRTRAYHAAVKEKKWEEAIALAEQMTVSLFTLKRYFGKLREALQTEGQTELADRVSALMAAKRSQFSSR